MCGGVFYQYNGRNIITYFPNPKAMLPVKINSGVELITWGRRKWQTGDLPMGGWARAESIEKGIWDKYFPKIVRIPVLKFMEKDIEGHSHWFDITAGRCLEGLLIQTQQEKIVYVVTIIPSLTNAIHERWPKVVVE